MVYILTNQLSYVLFRVETNLYTTDIYANDLKQYLRIIIISTIPLSQLPHSILISNAFFKSLLNVYPALKYQ